MSKRQYRLLTHVPDHAGGKMWQKGDLVTEDEIGAATLQALLTAEGGPSAEPYDPEAEAAARLSPDEALALKDAAADELRAVVSERDETIRRLRAKIEQLGGKSSLGDEAERRRQRAAGQQPAKAPKGQQPAKAPKGQGDAS